MAYNSPKSLVVHPGVDVDLTATGITKIFTSTSKFNSFAIILIGVNLSGIVGTPTVNFGWTAPDYGDLIPGTTITTPVNDDVQTIVIANTGPPFPLIPPSTDLYINVVIADNTATSNIQNVSIIGYYI